MEQQPFESQLALVQSLGPMGRQVSRPSADRLPEQFAVSYGISREKFVFAFRRYPCCAPRESSSGSSRSILDREDLSLLTFDLFASSEETQT
jgi:hypothetical protein